MNGLLLIAFVVGSWIAFFAMLHFYNMHESTGNRWYQAAAISIGIGGPIATAWFFG